MHPADWSRLSPAERMLYSLYGDESGPHWKVERVAELTGLDPIELHEHVEAERGWESHDPGYLHAVVESARVLLGAP